MFYVFSLVSFSSFRLNKDTTHIIIYNLGIPRRAYRIGFTPVIDTDRALFIARFPSNDSDYSATF